MCGIIGIVSKRDVTDRLVDGLRQVEYRGYDSAGVAVISDLGEGGIARHRAAGKLGALIEKIEYGPPLNGRVGIGHTRWATHGAPTEKNAHPHVSADGRLALVHNGIIENAGALLHELMCEGIGRHLTVEANTDTEILTFLVGLEVSRAPTFVEGVRRALKKVEGAYGIAVISADYPDEIIAARRGSPIAIGEAADGDRYAGSDTRTFAKHTTRTFFLENGELAILRFGKPTRIEAINGTRRNRAPEFKDLDPAEALSGKEGHPHFMHKEMWEVPEALRCTLAGRARGGMVHLGSFENPDAANRLRDAERIVILACGTSLFASKVGKLLIERYAQVPVEAAIASEWRYGARLVSTRDVVIAVSQSGETADTLGALEEAKRRGAYLFGITNRVGSSIARETEPSGIYLHAGPEIAVASTKSFSCQVAAFALFAARLSVLKNGKPDKRVRAFLRELEKLPDRIHEVLAIEDALRDIARACAEAPCIPIIGRGFNAPVADEGALKLWELPYHAGAHSFPAGEMKHGPIALLAEGTPVIAIVPDDSLKPKMLSNVSEALARGARVIALTTGEDLDVRELGPEERIQLIPLPKTAEELYPVPVALALQLFAYHLAVLRGTDVDQPRNLAKSVTVE